ncbi:MAG: hypothetical protein Q9162_007473 [Coniocarpon cinnabarinum]
MNSVGLREKSEKIPDAPIFKEGTAQDLYSWMLRIKSKLIVNHDRYPLNENKALEDRFGDPFQRNTERRNYANLRQTNKPFNEFIATFFKYAIEAGILEADQMYDLQNKISNKMQSAVSTYKPDTLQGFVKKLQFVDKNIQQLEGLLPIELPKGDCFNCDPKPRKLAAYREVLAIRPTKDNLEVINKEEVPPL